MEIISINMNNYTTEVGQSDKPVLIDFYADWCGPCKVIAGEVKAYADSQDEVKVAKLNVDDNGELAMLYSVMSIPTLVLIKDGKEIARKVGGCETKDIIEFVNGALK